MNIKRISLLAISALLLGSSTAAFSAEFWRTGTITRVLSDSTKYGGCMVKINTSIGNGCPSSGWVSLDCTETHYQGASKKNFAMVLAALALNKQVSLRVENTKKHDSYCVAYRVDLLN